MSSEKERLDQEDHLVVGSRTFRNRLLLGTSGYPNYEVMLHALEAAEAELVTVAIRRVNLDAAKDGGIFSVLGDKFTILPNTAGCYTAKDAILTAQLAREALNTNLIKLEVIGDDDLLMPDGEELLKAARELVRDGFSVMAYTNDDPILARKLEDAGCDAIMPLGAPIGSGMGIRNPYNFQLIRELISVPMICDAGIGTPSEAVLAMELGCDGVLLNTAVSGAKHPVQMARAFNYAVRAGRDARLAVRIPRRFYAKASSTMESRIETHFADKDHEPNAHLDDYRG